jgi:hypothetical protein
MVKSLIVEFLQEPYDNVRREAIADWERKKSRRQGKPFVGGQQQSSPLDIEPSRPAKRQRLTRPTTSPNQGPRKKPRRAGTAETARFQSVSQETVSSHSRVAEIKDSYEEEEIPSEENPNILVGVLMPRVDDTFDRDAYAKVTALSSQISEASIRHPRLGVKIGPLNRVLDRFFGTSLHLSFPIPRNFLDHLHTSHRRPQRHKPEQYPDRIQEQTPSSVQLHFRKRSGDHLTSQRILVILYIDTVNLQAIHQEQISWKRA